MRIALRGRGSANATRNRLRFCQEAREEEKTMQFRDEEWRERLRAEVDDLRESTLGSVLHRLTTWNEELDDRLRRIEGLFCLTCSGTGQIPCPSCGVDGSDGEGCGNCQGLGTMYCAECDWQGRRRGRGKSSDTPDSPVRAVVEESFRAELIRLLDKHGMGKSSDTPSFVLTNYLWDCLNAFNTGMRNRMLHQGIKDTPDRE